MTDLLNEIATQPGTTVGDDNLKPIEHDVQNVDLTVPAQTTGKPAVEVETVKVTETRVALDQVITDPHSPLAVQIPDAGRGPLDLPIHRLAKGTPEAQFAAKADADKAASKSKK